MENYSQQKNQSVYSVGSVVLGSFFGGPVATLWMMYTNSRASNKKIPAIKVVLTAVLYYFFLVAYSFFYLYDYLSDRSCPSSSYCPAVMPSSSPIIPFYILLSLALYSAIVWFSLDRIAIGRFLKNSAKKRSYWDVLIIVLVSLFVMVFSVSAAMFWRDGSL